MVGVASRGLLFISTSSQFLYRQISPTKNYANSLPNLDPLKAKPGCKQSQFADLILEIAFVQKRSESLWSTCFGDGPRIVGS